MKSSPAIGELAVSSGRKRRERMKIVKREREELEEGLGADIWGSLPLRTRRVHHYGLPVRQICFGFVESMIR